MSVSIQVHVHSLDGVTYPEEMHRVSEFIQAGVEAGVARVFPNVMAFDPHTGEPLFNVPFADSAASDLISHMHVVSPAAYTQVLLTDYIDPADYENTMEPILLAPYFGDDDDE
jgi:hypothetical protein